MRKSFLILTLAAAALSACEPPSPQHVVPDNTDGTVRKPGVYDAEPDTPTAQQAVPSDPNEVGGLYVETDSGSLREAVESSDPIRRAAAENAVKLAFYTRFKGMANQTALEQAAAVEINKTFAEAHMEAEEKSALCVQASKLPEFGMEEALKKQLTDGNELTTTRLVVHVLVCMADDSSHPEGALVGLDADLMLVAIVD